MPKSRTRKLVEGLLKELPRCSPREREERWEMIERHNKRLKAEDDGPVDVTPYLQYK